MGRGTGGGEQASSAEGGRLHMEHPMLRVADWKSARPSRLGRTGWEVVRSKGRASAGQGDGTILQSSNVCVALCPLPWAGHSIVPLSPTPSESQSEERHARDRRRGLPR
jgi:hypothetical protein